MNYTIQIVGDDELPDGMNKVIVERAGEPPLMLINGEPARAWRFMRAWEDMREPSSVPSVLLPARTLLLRAV